MREIQAKDRKDLSGPRRYLEKDILPAIGEKHMSSLTAEDCRAVIWRKKDSDPNAAATLGTRLAHVLKHLKAAGAKVEVDERLIEDHKYVVTQFLFPALTGSRYFLGFFLAYLHEDVGLTKPQALQAYQAAVLALHYAIGEFYAGVDAELAGLPLSEDIEDHGLEVQIPPRLRKLCDLGPEAYAGKYWQ